MEYHRQLICMKMCFDAANWTGTTQRLSSAMRSLWWWRIRRSLDGDSVATLVHAFVASRVDYCGSLLIGAPRKTTDKLQRVLNSAARIVSNTRKFDCGHLDFPRVKLASYGGRSFAYAGHSNWNSVPAYLRDSSLSLSSFKHHLKTFLFSFY